MPDRAVPVQWRIATDETRLRGWRPTASDTSIRRPTVTPATRRLCTQCRPALTAHPHSEQSGLPPKKHGSMRVVRSAETLVETRANVQWLGSAGGVANACSPPCGSTRAGYLRFSAGRRVSSRARDSRVSRSALISPHWECRD